MLKKFVSFCLLLSMIVTGIFQSGASIINANTAGGTSGKIGVISPIASTSYGEGNNAAKAFDGDSSTRWTSALSLNDTTKNQQYLQAVLPDDTPIERIDITWYTPWVDEYEIRISDDGERWQSILASSVTEKGIDNGKEGAAYLSQKDTSDVLSGVTAKYLQIAMTDVNYPGAESYLSVVDVSIYASDAEDRLTISSADTGDLGSYGGNTANKMINGTTDTAGDRWTSANISMNKAQILAGAIEFTFADPVNLTRFDIDWFNTPLSAYSLEAARADGTYTTLVDAKAMPASDMSVGVDALTHTIDCFKDLTEITGIRLTFDDTNAENNMYLSICEVRAYGSLSEKPDPWEINLMPEGASASSSSVQSGGMEAQKAIDRVQSTRWASSFGEQPSWLLIDLGETLSFDQMKLYQEAAYGKA